MLVACLALPRLVRGWLTGGMIVGALAFPVARLSAAEIPPPPRPITKLPSLASFIFEIQFPWRRWDHGEVTGPKGAFRATYTLKEPEYAVFDGAKTASGLDLAWLRALNIELVEQTRPAGSKGTFVVDGIVQISNNGNLGSWISWDFMSPKDTAIPAGVAVGTPLNKSSLNRARLDVSSPDFPALYAKLRDQSETLHKLVQSGCAWEAVVHYPARDVPMRVRLTQNAKLFIEFPGTLMRVSVHSGQVSQYTLIPDGDSVALAYLCERGGNYVDDGVFMLESAIGNDPFAVFNAIAERSDQGEYASLRISSDLPSPKYGTIFENCRIAPRDSQTATISAIGLPQTQFRRVQ